MARVGKKPFQHLNVELKNPLSRKIAAFLEANPDVSWAELDRRAGVAQSTTRAIMTARVKSPSLSMAERYAKGMGTTLSELMLPDESEQVREILNLAGQLSEAERQLIVDLARGLHGTRNNGRKRFFARIG
jgi:transcriptional regulator with XRE-family HTH domain